MPKLVVGLLPFWQGQFGRHRNGHIWIIVPHCFMRCLWKERNSRCFEKMRDPCQALSYFSLEPYWIGCLLCVTNHFLLFLIYLIYVIFVLDLLTWSVLGCHFFDINKTYYLYKKKCLHVNTVGKRIANFM